MRILIAEDDEAVRARLQSVLARAGILSDLAADGETAEFMGATGVYAAAVLDLGLPKMDGLSVLRAWRGQGVTMPVLVLTARGTWRDKVEGLRAGADDYLAKPFEAEELLARLEALVRRAHGHAAPTLSLGRIVIDPARRQVRLDGEDVPLTALEFRLLHHLALNAGRVVPYEELMEHAYGHPDALVSNVIEVAVSRIRKKLGAAAIRTVRGEGYAAGEAPPP